MLPAKMRNDHTDVLRTNRTVPTTLIRGTHPLRHAREYYDDGVR
jgi:hypothetical protein